MTPTDPLYSQQWHFSLMGDIEKIWDDYDGAGVSVAVYDEGVEYTHPDLSENFDSNFFTYNGVVYDPMPIDAEAGHGTSCAGLIGAGWNNGVGGCGVAPGVTLGAVNYLGDIQFQPDDVYDASMLWAANYDIMSNSWGWNGSYTKSQNLSVGTSQASHDIALWEEVVATGRGGLGTIILKAAGNETNDANGDGWNVSRYTLTISATDSHGNATSYTNYGSTILVAGPASAVTTDLTGDAGYNTSTDRDDVPVDYTSTFNGTSAATPTVAGVVALMLEANPNLGWRDVENILALSAHHTGSALGAATGTRNEIGTWTTMSGTLWNGGGTEFHMSYGYGMVDAFAAVRYAEAWAAFNAVPLTSANELSARFDHAGNGVAIPDSDGLSGTGRVSLSVNSTSTLRVEAVEVVVTLTHSDGTDLQMWLRAPDGTLVPIFTNDGKARTWDNGLQWTFEVDCLRGYSAQGTWAVVVEDTASGNTGTLTDVQITFHGAAATTSDVYNFTQDYQMMEGYQVARGVISDTNGGIDTLNFSSIETSIQAVMTAGGSVSFAGAKVASFGAGADVFERFYAGDGADSITGNSLNNTIWGARGNDTLNGGGGVDTLLGGVGNDVFVTDGGDVITEATNAGIDRVQSSATATLGANVENLTLTGSAAVNGNGNTLANSLTGNAGANILSGGAGPDTLAGGAGNDTYVTGGGDTITEGANAGTDLVQSSVSLTLGANLEFLQLTGSAQINATGNALANSLVGNGANNVLTGLDGNDTLNGGTGSDTLTGGFGDDTYVTNGGDTITEAASAGTDRVQSSVSLTLAPSLEVLILTGTAAINGTGNGLGNSLQGNAAANALSGLGGNDTLTGGAGADVFLFAPGGGADTITDFQDNVDTLRLDDAMWGGGKTIQQVLDTYGHLSGTSVVLTFGAVSVSLQGLTSVNSLVDDIVLT